MSHSKAFGITLALVLLPATAFAEDVGPQTRSEARAKAREACAGDAQKFCANIERAKGAMRTCLQTHETQLSEACRAARSARDAARAKNKS